MHYISWVLYDVFQYFEEQTYVKTAIVEDQWAPAFEHTFVNRLDSGFLESHFDLFTDFHIGRNYIVPREQRLN